jgi:hypothetical protein
MELTARALALACVSRVCVCVCVDAQNVIDHYENPRNVGSLNTMDIDVGTVRAR